MPGILENDDNATSITPESQPVPGDQSADPAAQAAQVADTVTMTMAEVNAKMAAARRDGIAAGEARARSESRPQPPAKPQKPKDLQAQFEELQESMGFQNALLDAGIRITPAQRADLEVLYKAAKPENAAEWVTNKISGWLGNTTTANANQGDAQRSTPDPITTPAPTPGLPVSDGGDATSGTGYHRKDDVTKWSKQEVDQFLADNPKNGRNLIRQKVMAHLAKVQVVFPRK